MTGLWTFFLENWWWLLPLLIPALVLVAIFTLALLFLLGGWLERLAEAYAERFMPPTNGAAFHRRINGRIVWRNLKKWWERQRFWSALASNSGRALGVLAIFGGTLVCLYLIGVPLSGLGDRIIKFAEGEGDIRGQTVLIVLGIPIAFILWWFRDMHVNAVLENQRKDVNLKEFQEIQMRASGAMDEKYPASARESLQIAATHQLAGFLKGEYGESFRRPAWELLRARLLASSERMGYRAVAEQTREWTEENEETRLSARQWRRAIESALESISLDNTGTAQRDVIREEWDDLFSGVLPISGTILDGIHAPYGAITRVHMMDRCSFVGATAYETHFEDAYLASADFTGASLSGSHFELARLSNARFSGAFLHEVHFEYALLADAHFEGSWLEEAKLQGARLRRTHLQGADLRLARLEGADLQGVFTDSETNWTGAVFDAQTKLTRKWADLSSEQKNKHRAEWIARGMIYVDKKGEPIDLPAAAKPDQADKAEANETAAEGE